MKGNKELTPLYILDYFKRSTNEDNPRMYKEIEDMLRDDYGLELSRQTVASKINSLIEDGWLEDAGRKRGAYYGDREFDESELMLLIYSVLSNKSIPPAQADELVDRLNELGGECFDVSDMRIIGRDNNDHKSGNQELFLNLERVHDAIRNGRQMEFDYYRYGIDKNLSYYAHYAVSPYFVAMKNQKLYLLCGYEEDNTLRYFRIEHMKNVKTIQKGVINITKMNGYEEGMDLNRHTATLPYMFSDKPVQITFRADASNLNQIIDWFGKEITVQQDPDDKNKILAAVKTSPTAMKYWAMQYMESVEILAPQQLRNEIYWMMRIATMRYAPNNTPSKIIHFKVKNTTQETQPEEEMKTKIHESEDSKIPQLDYFFKSRSNNLIADMFKRTDDKGILNVPVDPCDKPENTLGKKMYRCKMNWNDLSALEMSDEFDRVYKSLYELAGLHAEIESLDLEKEVSAEALEVWNTFFKDYDCEELERILEKGVEHLIEKEKNPNRFSNSDDDGKWRVPQDERGLFTYDFRDITNRLRKQYNFPFLYDMFIRIRRVYLLIAYKASGELIEMEARRLARYMALNKYCERYDMTYL